VSRWSVSSGHVWARHKVKVSCSSSEQWVVAATDGYCSGAADWQHRTASASPATAGFASLKLTRRCVRRRSWRWIRNWTAGPESHPAVRCHVELLENSSRLLLAFQLCLYSFNSRLKCVFIAFIRSPNRKVFRRSQIFWWHTKYPFHCKIVERPCCKFLLQFGKYYFIRINI